jgi:hypothetical protein
MTLSIIIIVISILSFFFILNNLILYKKEHFKKLRSGRVCGEFNDTCRLNQNNVSSCCKGYYCGLKLGKYKSKICIPIKNISNATSPKSLKDSPFDIINYPAEPSKSDLAQKQDANMGYVMTEEEIEEEYYQLLLDFCPIFGMVNAIYVYEDILESIKKGNTTYKKEDSISYAKYYYNFWFPAILNGVRSEFSVNGSQRKDVKKFYEQFSKHEIFSKWMDSSNPELDRYKKLFNIEFPDLTLDTSNLS